MATEETAKKPTMYKKQSKAKQKAGLVAICILAAFFIYAGLKPDAPEIQTIEKIRAINAYEADTYTLPSCFTKENLQEKDGTFIGLFGVELPGTTWTFTEVKESVYKASTDLDSGANLSWFFIARERNMFDTETTDPRPFMEDFLAREYPSPMSRIERTRYSFATEDGEAYTMRADDYVEKYTPRITVVVNSKEDRETYGEKDYFFNFSGCFCAVSLFYEMENEEAALSELSALMGAAEEYTQDFSEGIDVSGFFLPDGCFIGPSDEGFYGAIDYSYFSGVDFFVADEIVTKENAKELSLLNEKYALVYEEPTIGDGVFSVYNEGYGRICLPGNNGKTIVIGFAKQDEARACFFAQMQITYLEGVVAHENS